ncbi:MAG: acyltransferase [Anaerolineaceae bacterium]|nr:acyltransferase [Anaerolineaceae bacterium]
MRMQVVYEEISLLHPRIRIANLLTAPLPYYVGCRWRAQVLRLVGFQIGKGTTFFGMPSITGMKDLYKNLTIGENCIFNFGCSLEVGENLTIGNFVSMGHEVMILTSTHEIGSRFHRLGPILAKPVTIEDGVWLGSRSMVLPGVTVGAGSVVAAGAIVTKDVPPNTIVAGVPATVKKELD